MTVSELIEKLRQVPQDLEVHVMADLDRDLVDIASVDLITPGLTMEPFVVIDLLHENGGVEDQDPRYAAPEIQDSSTPKFVKN
jgi:hypothetical protein